MQSTMKKACFIVPVAVSALRVFDVNVSVDDAQNTVAQLSDETSDLIYDIDEEIDTSGGGFGLALEDYDGIAAEEVDFEAGWELGGGFLEYQHFHSYFSEDEEYDGVELDISEGIAGEELTIEELFIADGEEELAALMHSIGGGWAREDLHYDHSVVEADMQSGDSETDVFFMERAHGSWLESSEELYNLDEDVLGLPDYLGGELDDMNQDYQSAIDESGAILAAAVDEWNSADAA